MERPPAAGVAAVQPTPALWLTTWLVAALLSVVIAGAMTLRKARRGGQGMLSGPGRKLVLSFAPPTVVAALLTPLLFTVISLWSSLEGSILFWGLVLAGFTAVATYKTHTRLGALAEVAELRDEVLVVGALLDEQVHDPEGDREVAVRLQREHVLAEPAGARPQRPAAHRGRHPADAVVGHLRAK